MDRVAVFLLAGGRGNNFGVLSEHRPKAAFPVAGYYRIIDFALSNLSHSGARRLGIIIQFLPASLMEHVGSGRPWDFDMADRTLRFMTPFVGVRETRWLHGTGDAVAKNINLMDLDKAREVLILSADHVYNMNYQDLVDAHRAGNADVTMACVEVPPERQHPRFGNVILGPNGRVTRFVEKPEHPLSSLVSMGIYCFRKEVLLELLTSSTPAGDRNEFSLSGDVLQPHIGQLRGQAFVSKNPWYYLGDMREYFDFHMQLARGQVDLFSENWNVMTNFSDRNLGSRAPAFFTQSSQIANSIVSPGCRIEGRVENSVLSPGVMVAPGAIVRNCILLHDVRVDAGAQIDHAIVDKDVVIEEGVHVVARPDLLLPGQSAIQAFAKGSIVRKNEVIQRVGLPG